jgi:peptide subunit release factor 1 (eRF1)
MQTNELTQDSLRRLAELRPGGRVLSVYLNLDPSEFATPQARATQITSVLDEADRKARAEQDNKTLREDVERLGDLLKNFDFQGAHGLAVFVAGDDDLLEAIKLPRPVESSVTVDDAPHIEPLVTVDTGARYCVVLVSRAIARIFRGSRDRLEQVAVIEDPVHRRHDQGGLSQARYQRSIDKETHDHLKHTVEELLKRFNRSPFDALFIAAPDADFTDFERELHPYLKERFTGRVNVDVENSTNDEVREAAAEVIEAYERKLEGETLDRLVAEKNAGGRGATGLEDTLAALNEQRVEVLLIQEAFDAAGVCCPQCGWLGVGVSRCPADETETLKRPDITDLAVRRAITQSAEVVVVRDDDRLEPRGSIAALLRF